MKFLYSFIISFCSLLGFSQTILYQQENASRTVQDPQAILLAQGFKAAADTSNPFVAKIGPATENPGGGPTDSNAGATNPYGTTAPEGQSFHDTKGNIEVNGAGQLQFTLPIALPPGVKSVAPQISLIYTSGSGNGIAGYGWNLSGITAISRIGKNIEKDGEVKGVQLDYSDYYSFNGQRLILKSGEYGKDGAEYVTEKYSNVKIKSIGNTLGLSGPDYFLVLYEDGSQAKYQKTFTNGFRGGPATEYNITEWADAQGNLIVYSYESDQLGGRNGGVSRLSTISWGGNKLLNTLHFNEIKFNYINRDLKESSYVNGAFFIQDKLLKDITVKISGNQFKKYIIKYTRNGTSYQFVESVQEINSMSEEANPISFTYETDTTTNSIMKQDSRYDEILGNNIISGDFDGDGKVDFINSNKLMLRRLDGTGDIYTFNRELIGWKNENIFVGSHPNVSNASALFNVHAPFSYTTWYENAIKINICKYDKGLNTIILQESKRYDLTGYYTNSDPELQVLLQTSSGDFNGDGVTDFIVSATWAVSKDIGEEGPNVVWTYFDNKRFYVNPLSDTITPIDMADINVGDIKTVNDFLGDGTQQILILKNNLYKLYKLDIKTNKLLHLYDFPNTEDASLPLYYGDFNGDRKTDIIIPVAEDSSDWKMYISTGNSFRKEYYSNLFLYKPAYTGAATKYRNTLRSYYTPDLNKDGKSDFLIFESQVWFRQLNINNKDSSYGFNYLRNDGVDATGKPIFNNIYSLSPKEIPVSGNLEDEDINYSKYGEHYIPLIGNFRIAEVNTEFAIIHKTKLITWELGGKLDKVSRITSINQGAVKTDIEYSNLANNGNIYKSYSNISPIQYPYVNIVENINYNVVSRLIQGERKQEFRYRDLIGHLQGRGMIGFRQTARSIFFADGFENTKIWTGSEINPLNEGLPYKDWSIRTTNENNIFPANISLNNTQLLSFKQYDYKIDKLLNGNIVNSIVIGDADKSKVVLSINPYITTTKDFLKNIKIVHTVEQYNELYLPKKSVTKINDGFAISTLELEYYPSNMIPGANYSIGKPKIKTNVVQAYGDTKSGKEEYTYENNLLKTQITWNRNNSESITETYTYDGFGNITRKLTSNSVDSQIQSTETEYDSKGRFAIKKKDNLGLETNIIYNDWGEILNQTDPLGNTLTNTYDGWGKLLTSKTNLSGTTTYQYERDNNSNIIVTEYNPNGGISKKYTNKLIQEYKVSTKAFGQGQYISKETQYDILGRKIKESESYFEGQYPSQWNDILYNDTVFPATTITTAFNGKKLETSISGLTTNFKELNGYGRTTTKREDALGNTVATTDKGGTINFSYNAAGEQIKAQYAENTVTTQYDVWGRKSEFNDPSNGIYKYEYDGLGKPKKIVSPKGTKEYTYNNNGQLISQKELSMSDGGESTNKMIFFSYDNKGRVISKSGTSKGQAYSSNISYDAQGRILSSTENNNGKYFIQKGITYDDKARVISYEKQLYSSGVLTKVQIQNEYSNWSGELFQVKDKNTGKVLWQLQEANAKGQVLKAKLGSANINNTYDANGFLLQVSHSSVVKPGILQLSYSFDAIKNELKNRTTGGDFNIIESFDYDDNNRLVNWTNPVTGTKPTTNRNTYDVKGRILENDQVGSIKFQNSQKIYQPTSMVLNAAGTQSYNNDLIQSIVYNENNDPVFIDGEKGDVSFQYGLISMRQRASYGGNFSSNGEGKFTKFYSEDGSFEVIKDNTTGKEKHILFIGGTPYESNIVYLKDYSESSSSFRFLHKDYIGSVLAISDGFGNKLEQRHYDAWGNFSHLQIGNGAILTGNALNQQLSTFNLVIDRGYTSHEHFAEVGIIHMNGRLYDPLLRRFLNADENIQDPTNTQNYNKYGYVMNNPLMYNDPSGEFIWWIPPLVAAVSELFNMYYTQTPFNYGRFYVGLATSYFSAGISSGIGSIFQVGDAVANKLGSTWTIVAKAGAHAFAQGSLSYVQGGNFWSGALSGAFASVANDLLDLATTNAGENSILRSDGFVLLNGAVSGGIGSVLGGGNFWMGAGQGLIVSAFNFLAHKETNAVEDNNTDVDCPTCPKNAKNWQTYTEDFTILNKEFWTWDNIINGRRSYYYLDGTWNEIVPFAGTVPVGPAGGFNLLKSFRSALSLAKGGLTNVGRAIQKHPNILRLIGKEASSVTTNASRNAYGAKSLKYIIKNGTKEIRSHNNYGKVVDYKLPSGLGARFNAVTNEFIGFLGRGL